MIEAVSERLRRRVPAGGRQATQSLRLPARVPAPILIVALGVLVLLGGGWLWVRDSSLVAVKRVSVTGVSGPDAAQVRSALAVAARDMTTLDVRIDQLYSAVAPYPVVKDLRVETQFPHGMRIRVIEQIPVGVVVVDGRRMAVAGDGTLLHDVAAGQGLAVIPLRVAPGGTRLTERDALGAVAVLAAAPYSLLGRVSQVTRSGPHGLVAQLRNGPSIYFGDQTALSAKWQAASQVIADAGSAGAVYVDVSDPTRPAAGGVGLPGPSSGTTSTAPQTGTPGSSGPAATVPQTSVPGATVSPGPTTTTTPGTGGSSSPATGGSTTATTGG